jgi:hypothetical protein
VKIQYFSEIRGFLINLHCDNFMFLKNLKFIIDIELQNYPDSRFLLCCKARIIIIIIIIIWLLIFVTVEDNKCIKELYVCAEFNHPVRYEICHSKCR